MCNIVYTGFYEKPIAATIYRIVGYAIQSTFMHKNSQIIMNWLKIFIDKTALHRNRFVLNDSEYFYRLRNDQHQRQQSTSLLPLQVVL